MASAESPQLIVIGAEALPSTRISERKPLNAIHSRQSNKFCPESSVLIAQLGFGVGLGVGVGFRGHETHLVLVRRAVMFLVPCPEMPAVDNRLAQA